jgi:hypothetical protein
LFALTWNDAVTPSGRRICALRASARRTSDSASTSWPTPVVNDAKGSDYAYSQGNHDRPVLKLGGQRSSRIELEHSSSSRSGRNVDAGACIDGKARPVEPVTFPLAHGVSGRVAVRLPSESSAAAIQEHWYNRSGALKGFGNAIVPCT